MEAAKGSDGWLILVLGAWGRRSRHQSIPAAAGEKGEAAAGGSASSPCGCWGNTALHDQGKLLRCLSKLPEPDLPGGFVAFPSCCKSKGEENQEEKSWGCPTGIASPMETHHCHQPEKMCVEFFPCQLDLDKHHLAFAFTPLINRDRGLRSKPTSGGISPSLILTTAAAWDTHIPVLRDLFAHIDCARCKLFWSMPVQNIFLP